MKSLINEVALMVIRKEKSSRKRRGFRVHGYGRTGQHRKSGSKGGVGKAGRKSGKHKYSWVLKYEPDYFGKHGFHRPRKKDFKEISLLEISNSSEKWLKEGIAELKNGYVEIDLSKLGYDKVVAGGSLDKKYIIKAKYFTERALEKIKHAGSIALTKDVSS